MTQTIDADVTTDVPQGRDAAPLTYPLLVVLALLALVAGLVAFAGSSHSKEFFAWGFASPVSSALMGAGLLGVVPMMFSAAVRQLWEEVRIAVLPAGVLVSAMLVVSLLHHGDLALGGGAVIALALAWGWLLAMGGLTAFVMLTLLTQLREPGFPLSRTVPLPRWTVPLIGVEGAAFLGLGAGLLIKPDFWGHLVPWTVSTVDARALGVWCLTLGVALLQALAEDDLARVRPGLLGIVGVGSLGLVALGWHHGDVTWSGWSAPIAVVLLVSLVATGSIGIALVRRAAPVG